MGILAIIFACLGGAGALLFTAGPVARLHHWRPDEGYEFVVTWVWLATGLSVVLFLVHLYGGILACMYKRLGLRLLTGYAVGAIVVVAIELIVMFGFVARNHEISSVVAPRGLLALLGLPWPVLVLVLVNTRRATQACEPQGP